MYIKQHREFEVSVCNWYYSVKKIANESDYPLYYLGVFFNEGFPSFYRKGVAEYIKNLNNHDPIVTEFEMCHIFFDLEKNLTYVSETYNWSNDTTPEINQLLEKDAIDELCHRGILGHVVMKKDNMYYLLIKWERFADKRVPFVLIYQDDRDWYDTASFETKDAMDKFIADHTKSEKIE